MILYHIYTIGNRCALKELRIHVWRENRSPVRDVNYSTQTPPYYEWIRSAWEMTNATRGREHERSPAFLLLWQNSTWHFVGHSDSVVQSLYGQRSNTPQKGPPAVDIWKSIRVQPKKRKAYVTTSEKKPVHTSICTGIYLFFLDVLVLFDDGYQVHR